MKEAILGIINDINRMINIRTRTISLTSKIDNKLIRISRSLSKRINKIATWGKLISTSRIPPTKSFRKNRLNGICSRRHQYRTIVVFSEIIRAFIIHCYHHWFCDCKFVNHITIFVPQKRIISIIHHV